MTLRELREQLDVPRATVALRLGMSEATVEALETVRTADASGNTLSLYVNGLGGQLCAVVGSKRVRL